MIKKFSLLLMLIGLFTVAGCNDDKRKNLSPIEKLVDIHLDAFIDEESHINGFIRWKKFIYYKMIFIRKSQDHVPLFQKKQEVLIDLYYKKIAQITHVNIVKEVDSTKVNLAFLFYKNWREIAYEWALFKNSDPKTKNLSNKEYKDYLNNIEGVSLLQTREENGYKARYFALSNYLSHEKGFCDLQFLVLSSMVSKQFNFYKLSTLKNTIFGFSEKNRQCNEMKFYIIDRAMLYGLYHTKLKHHLGTNLSKKKLKIVRSLLVKYMIEYLDNNNYTQQVILSNQHLLKE